MALGLMQLIIALGYILFLILPTWRILERLGRPGWLGLLAIIPIANLALLWWVAYSRWPVESKGF